MSTITGTALQNKTDNIANIASKPFKSRLDYLIEKKRIRNNMLNIETNEEKREELSTKITKIKAEIQAEIVKINGELQRQPEPRLLTIPYVVATKPRRGFTPPAGYDPEAMKAASSNQGGRKRKSKKGRAKITKRRKSMSNQKKSKRHFR